MDKALLLTVSRFGQTYQDGKPTGRTAVLASVVQGQLEDLNASDLDLSDLRAELFLDDRPLMQISMSCEAWTPSKLAAQGLYNFMVACVIPEDYNEWVKAGRLQIRLICGPDGD